MVKWILGILVLMALAIAIAMMGQAPEMVSGGPHPDYSGMSIGGDGAARLQGLWVEGLILYFATFISMPVFCVLGIAKRNRSQPFWTLMGGVTALNLMFAALLIYFYISFLNTGETFLLLGFPAPTAMMMFGCWGSAFLFTVIFIWKFDTFIFTPEDEAAVEALVKACEQQSAEA